MVYTSEISPSPALAPFVKCYTYREFETDGMDIIKPWHASHQSKILFFLKALPVKLTDLVTGKILKTGKSCDVVGMSTKCNGLMTFNGSYSFFEITFSSSGFHKIFNKPPLEIADKIVWSEDIFNADIRLLHEQLYKAGSVPAMAECVNTWLLGYLNKQRKIDYNDKITSTVHLIAKNAGQIKVDSLASFACMSTRNFERAFLLETGISPKQLCCITRFNAALQLKLRYPLMRWTSVAYQSGYFDQMHLIKDFKKFCGIAPSSLLSSPLFEEEFTSRTSAI